MGIQGLLPFLAESTREAHINEFENEFVAIDAYCWLHKGIYSCAYELAINKPSTKYVKYCMRYIDMLLYFKVKPILVFDGRQLSSKSETEKKRRQERKSKAERGRALIRAGNHQEGRRLLSESVDVTHKLALKLIEECREKNIDCIVAPYEADAQLAFFCLRNIVKCVVTEDSDLLAYGCERVMFKLSLTNGMGHLIEKDKIYLSLKMNPEELNEDLFRYMCILSGCDYLPSLESIGPANALKFIKMLKGNNIYEVLPKLPSYLNKKKAVVTPEYLAGFKIADNTFKYHLVYDPFVRAQVPLQPITNDDDLVGTKLPDDQAFDMAVGNIDPITGEKLSNYDPDKSGKGFSLLWKTDFLPNATPRQPLVSGWLGVKSGHRENFEMKFAQPVAKDLKKQRTPYNTPSIRNLSTKNSVPKVPKCGFIFDPKTEKKNVTKDTDESNSLISRYFSRTKDKGRHKQVDNAKDSASDKRKDESHDEYLQRLYNEYFPLGENESEEYDAKKRSVSETVNTVPEKFCSLCGNWTCICLSKSGDVFVSQALPECDKDIEEHSKSKENSSAQHFLLDEIYKSQLEKSETLANIEKREEEQEEVNEKKGKVSPSQSLSFNFSKLLSKISDTPKTRTEKETSEVEVLEKENAEIVCIGDEEPARSPSPVFKVQRILKRNCRLGNISDTAGTPTSVYFSSFDSERLNTSTPQVSSRHTPATRKMPSVRSFNSVPSKSGKSSLKTSSVNRTLFQFGFKKRRREENESEE